MAKSKNDLQAQIRELNNNLAIYDDQVAKLEAEVAQVYDWLSDAESRAVSEARRAQALKEIALLTVTIAEVLNEDVETLIGQIFVADLENAVLRGQLEAAIEEIAERDRKAAAEAAAEAEKSRLVALPQNCNWVTNPFALTVNDTIFQFVPNDDWEQAVQNGPTGLIKATWTGTATVTLKTELFGSVKGSALVTRTETPDTLNFQDVRQTAVLEISIGKETFRFEIGYDGYMRPDGSQYDPHPFLIAQRERRCEICGVYHPLDMVGLAARFAD